MASHCTHRRVGFNRAKSVALLANYFVINHIVRNTLCFLFPIFRQLHGSETGRDLCLIIIICVVEGHFNDFIRKFQTYERFRQFLWLLFCFVLLF